MPGGDGDELAGRAIAYAESAVEGVRLASWELLEEAASAMSERVSAAELADQHEVARLVARAFAIGWEARGEELGRRGRALGGVADDVRRRARHANAPRRPSRRRTEGES